jgi:hypothetical protein
MITASGVFPLLRLERRHELGSLSPTSAISGLFARSAASSTKIGAGGFADHRRRGHLEGFSPPGSVTGIRMI